MLDKHLTVKTYGTALQQNVVLWKDYRVTVLDAGLFRIEKNDKCVWRDKATQSVWYRNMPVQNFSVEKGETGCKISTERVTLHLCPSIEDCKVDFAGKLLNIDNAGNLLGTYRTLDNCDGDMCFIDWDKHKRKYTVPLGVGVCSESGLAVLDDSGSLSLDQDGKIEAEKGVGIDRYVFVYGADYRAAVNVLYKITGMPPMLPRYAFGNWWSRYFAYTDRSYLTLLDKFENNDVPLTVATLDMDWHYSHDLEQEFGVSDPNTYDEEKLGSLNGWTGYSWNRHLFPNYKAFLKEIKSRGLNITLNLHPADGVRWFEDCYTQMATAMGVDPTTKKQIPFDMTDDNFVNNYFSVIHKPYERDGVKFWWIDWQQGEQSAIAGLDPLWLLNHFHYLDMAQNEKRPIILSRYCGVGAHRYPIGFSGDTHITWRTLKYLPYFTSTASNIGYTYWSHDIGGHMSGETDGQLYLRFIQFGVFSPINRLHCSNNKGLTKEPWFYENGTGEIAQNFLRFRHRLIPFLYSASYATHSRGRALIEPMYYDYPNDREAYDYVNEYTFGGLIVSPVTEKLRDDGFARVDMWLPNGKYTDIFTGDEYSVSDDGKRVTLLRRLESLPVLAKAGTILPLSLDKGNSVKNPQALEIKVFSGKGEYTLYEDGADGEYFTHFVVDEVAHGVALTISGCGVAQVVPKNRKLRVSFENIRNGHVRLSVNGKARKVTPGYFEKLTIEIKFDSNNSYKIVATDDNSDIENLLLRVNDVLSAADDSVAAKTITLREIEKQKTITDIVKIIDESKLKDINKLRVKEAVGLL